MILSEAWLKPTQWTDEELDVTAAVLSAFFQKNDFGGAISFIDTLVSKEMAIKATEDQDTALKLLGKQTVDAQSLLDGLEQRTALSDDFVLDYNIRYGLTIA